MIVLRPITGSQVMRITSRELTLSSPYVLTITEDGTGEFEVVNDSDGVGITDVQFNEYWLDVTLNPTPDILLKEGGQYSAELISDSNVLVWRGKIYVTAQTDFDVKHEQSQPLYTEFNNVDDNTYVIN